MSQRLMGALLIVLCGATAYAQLREKPTASSSAGAYRVTSWPAHTGADQQYEDTVQEHLNRMAAEGWRFQGDLAGQFGKMMVFERVSGR